jgi:hypothetical protein
VWYTPKLRFAASRIHLLPESYIVLIRMDILRAVLRDCDLRFSAPPELSSLQIALPTMRTLASSFYAFLITCILLVSFFVYGLLNFYQDPGSIFFDPNRALERRYSQLRQVEANSFRDTVLSVNSTTLKRSWRAGQNSTVCGVFITVARNSGTGNHPLEVRTE